MCVCVCVNRVIRIKQTICGQECDEGREMEMLRNPFLFPLSPSLPSLLLSFSFFLSLPPLSLFLSSTYLFSTI